MRRNAKISEHPFVLHNHEEFVDLLVEAAKKRSEAEHTFQQVRNLLDHVVDTYRKDGRKHGVHIRKVIVSGTNSAIDYLFKNAFGNYPAYMKRVILDKLGEDVATELFRPKEEFKLKPGAAAALKKVLGDDFDDFFEVEQKLAPVDNFRERVFEMYDELSEEQKEALECVEHDLAYRPQLSVK